MEPFHTLFRKLRERACLTQGALASKVGCKKQMVSLIESGKRHVSKRLAPRFADALVPEDNKRPRFMFLALRGPQKLEKFKSEFPKGIFTVEFESLCDEKF